MNELRRCSRPGCPNRAVATLTYVYADSTAVVGPLAAASDPHSWDLCAAHALRITAPRGWDLVRHPDIDDAVDDDLTALLDAVTGSAPGTVGGGPVRSVDAAQLRRLGVPPGEAAAVAAAPGPRSSDGARAHLRLVRPDDPAGADAAGDVGGPASEDPASSLTPGSGASDRR